MIKKNSGFKIFIILNILILFGCQNTKVSGPPDFLTNPKACSLVINQNMRYENRGFEEIWFRGTLEVVNGLVMSLNKHDYKALSKISDPSGERLTIEKVNHEIITNQCRNIIKVVHVKDNSTEFGFNVEILEPDILQKKGNAYKLKSTYVKAYRFPLTKKTFDTLSLSGVGERAAKDIISNWQHLNNATD